MGDECFFDIMPLQPSRDLSASPWLNEISNGVNGPQIQGKNVNRSEEMENLAENASLHARPMSNQQTNNMDTWDPMDDDFACSSFNSYENFDVLGAERPGERSPEKSVQQSPEKKAEEISLYVCNIPLAITPEGIKNLFLAVGDVRSCKILPPRDPSSDTKFGFVRFGTGREALNAIETYDGFYIGSERKLRVRMAHKKRVCGDVFATDGEGNSSYSDGANQDMPTNEDLLLNNNKYNNDGESTTEVTNQNTSISLELPTEVNHTNGEEIGNENLPNEASEKSSALPRAKMPCTNCDELCTQRCSACKAPYCSRKCQKADKARHKLVCTYVGNTSMPKPNAAETKPEPAEMTVVKEHQYDPDSDSDFDCIDISLDTEPNLAVPKTPEMTVKESQANPDSDSDFDCIDISLDTKRTSTKGESSRKEVENKAESSAENNPLDSGCSYRREDTASRKSDAPCDEGLNSDATSTVPSHEVKLESESPTSQMSPATKFVAYVTVVSTGNTFWVVVRNPDYSRFCELCTQLVGFKEEDLEALIAPIVGSLCLTRFSVDNCWYRSRITQGNAEQVEVIFVDYGNTEWKSVHDLYQLPQGFAGVAPQAQQLCLKGVTVASELEGSVRKFLDSLVSGKTVVAELVSSNLGYIPDVILRDIDSEENINELVENYVQQLTGNAVGCHEMQGQASFGKSVDTQPCQATGTSDNQLLQNTLQQGPTCESSYPMTGHVSDNASANNTMMDHVLSVPVEDTVTSHVLDNAEANDPVTDYEPSYLDNALSYNPMMDDMPRVPVKDTSRSHVSDNAQANNPMTDYVPSHPVNDSLLTTYVPSNASSNDSLTKHESDTILCNEPMGGYVSDTSLINNLSTNYKSDRVPSKDTVTGDNTLGMSGYDGSDDVSKKNLMRIYSPRNISPSDSTTSHVSSINPSQDTKTSYTRNDGATMEPRSNYAAKDSMVSASNENPVNSDIGYGPHMASEVPSDVLPSRKTFDILVCHFVSPSLFWVWFLDTARETFSRLVTMLSSSYKQSTYSDYLPRTSELIAAKFTDGVWYRAEVDCINDDGTVRVTFIDFGNTEDVSRFDIRVIDDAFVSIPRLASKCALSGMELEPSKQWSAECVQFCDRLMLNKLGSATVEDRILDTLVLRVNVDINGEMRSVVDEIVKQGYLSSEKLLMQDAKVLADALSEQTLQSSESTSHPYQPLLVENQPALHDKDEAVSPESRTTFPDIKPVLPASQSVAPSRNKPVFPDLTGHDYQSGIPENRPGQQQAFLAVPNTKPSSTNFSPALPGISYHKPDLSGSPPVTDKPVLTDEKPVLPENHPATSDIPGARPPLHRTQAPLSQNKPAVSSNQSVRQNNTCAAPGEPRASATSQVVFPNNKPVYPIMKPPTHGNPPALPEVKPALLGNQPAPQTLKSAVPENESRICDSKHALPTRRRVSCNFQTVPLDNKPAALLNQPVSSSSNNSAFPDSHVSSNVDPSLPLSERNKQNNATAHFQPADCQSVPTSNENSSLQSTAPVDQVPEDSQNIIPTRSKLESSRTTPLPLPSVPTATSFDVIVNDVLSADKFYAQMIEPSLVSQLQKCVRQLNEYVAKSHPPKVENVTIGSLGCAKFAQDNVWYRAEVFEIKDLVYRVRFIDFGNVQDVRSDGFLEPPEFFYQLAPQTIRCRLGMSQYWGEQSKMAMRKLTWNKRMGCTLIELIDVSPGPQYAVKLQATVGGELVDVAEELSKALGSGRKLSRPSNTPLCNQQTLFSSNVLVPAVSTCGIEKIGETYDVYVTSAHHPSYFFAQNASTESQEYLKRLTKEVNSYYNSTDHPRPFTPKVNTFCAACKSTKSSYFWFRAYVKSTSPKGFTIFSLDFGFVTLAEETLLRPLEERFCEPPFGAVLFTVANVAPAEGKLWNDEAMRYFQDKITTKVVRICLKGKRRARLFADVYDPDLSGEISLRTALLAKGWARKTGAQNPTGSLSESIESQAHQEENPRGESISDNYDVSFAQGLSDRADDGTCSGADPNVGQAFPTTTQCGQPTHQPVPTLSRISTEHDIPNSVNNSVSPGGTNNVPGFQSNSQNPGQRPVPGFHSHKQVPVQKHAPDFPPDQVTSRSPPQEFNTNRRAPHQNQLQGRFTSYPRYDSSTNDTQEHSRTGHISRNDNVVPESQSYKTIPVDSSLQMLPNGEKHDVFVSWVDSPDSFWVQQVVVETVKGYATMSERLNSACENSTENIGNSVKTGDYCCSKFAGDWCRCKIEALPGNGSARVFYVDYGNREDVQLVNVKPLADEFRVLPAQAVQCALADVRASRGGWSPQAGAWLKDKILSKLVAVEVERVADVLRVKVYDKSSSVSVNSLMIQTGF